MPMTSDWQARTPAAAPEPAAAEAQTLPGLIAATRPPRIGYGGDYPFMGDASGPSEAAMGELPPLLRFDPMPEPGRTPTRIGLPPVEERPFGDVFGAAWRDSSVYQLQELFYRDIERPLPMEGYDPLPDIEGTKYAQYPETMLAVRSPAEMSLVKQSIDRMEEDRIVLGQHEAAGIILGMAMDPVGLATMALSGPGGIAVGALKAGAVGAAVSTANQAVRLAYDPQKRLEDAFQSVAIETAFAATFGKLMSTTSAEVQAFKRYRDGEPPPPPDRSMGSAGNPALATAKEGGEAPAPGAFHLPDSPLARATASDLPDESGFFARQIMPSATLSKNQVAGVVDVGSVHSDQYPLHRILADAVEGSGEDYLAYRGEGMTGVLGSMRTSIGDFFKKPAAGVLSPLAFKERAWTALITGADDPISHVNSAAAKFRSVIDEVGEKAAKAGLIDKKQIGAFRTWQTGIGESKEKFMPRVWSLGAIDADLPGFQERVRQWLEISGGNPAEAANVARDIRARGAYTPLDDEHVGLATSAHNRRFDAPTLFFSEFVEKDAERLMRYYTRTMGVDAALASRFGGAAGEVDEGLRRTLARQGVAMRDPLNQITRGWIDRMAGAAHGTEAEAVYDRMMERLSRLREEATEAYKGMPPNAGVADINTIRARFQAEKKAAGDTARAELEAATGVDHARDWARMENNLEDMRTLRDLQRGTYGQAEDPMAWSSRTIRLAKQITNMLLLSGATAALPDLGAIIMREGMTRTMGVAISAYRAGLDMAKLAGSEARLAGQGVDMALAGRFIAISDLSDVSGRYDAFSRAVDNAASAAYTLNLMNPWTATIKQVAGAVIQSRMLDSIIAFAEGGAVSAIDIARLAQSGIGRETAEKIAAQATAHGTKTGDMWLPNSGAWTDSGAISAFRRALAEGIDQAIVTPNKGEVAAWISTEFGSVIGQYLSFAQATVNRLIIPALQERDARTMSGLLSMVGIGMMVESIRNKALGHEGSQDFGTWLYRGIGRSGIAGYWDRGFGLSDTLTDNRYGMGALFGIKPRETSWADKVVALAGPAAGVGSHAVKAGYYAVTGDGDALKEAGRLIPMGRTTQVQFLFNTLASNSGQ